MFYAFKEHVLSQQLCNMLLEKAMFLGFSPSTVNVYGQVKDIPSIRNNQRIEHTDFELAQSLQKLVIENFPDLLTFEKKDFSQLNDHFRFYHYSPGEFFKPHKDGHTKIEGQESFITVLFYLNDTEGGETILMPEGYSRQDSWIYIKPTQGSVLLFEHKIWHEGRPVTSGEKIVLRSDIFYKNF